MEDKTAQLRIFLKLVAGTAPLRIFLKLVASHLLKPGRWPSLKESCFSLV
jgi:hypothetical protein